MSNALDLGSLPVGSSSSYGGYENNWGGVSISPGGSQTSTTIGGADANIPYGGSYIISFNGALEAQNVIGSTKDQKYTGYMQDFGGTVVSTVPQANIVDNNPVVPWPKNQQIYYKLEGFNNNTSLYENWIIVEEIVPRPETFDPTGNTPNIDYGIYFTPPSGNKLTNIRIIARWIQ